MTSLPGQAASRPYNALETCSSTVQNSGDQIWCIFTDVEAAESMRELEMMTQGRSITTLGVSYSLLSLFVIFT